jgi:hypothetical protein
MKTTGLVQTHRAGSAAGIQNQKKICRNRFHYTEQLSGQTLLC